MNEERNSLEGGKPTKDEWDSALEEAMGQEMPRRAKLAKNELMRSRSKKDKEGSEVEEIEKEGKEEILDPYDELEDLLRSIRPHDPRIRAIVHNMGYVSLDNLEALRDNLRLAGWRINDIKLALRGWAYRRGLAEEEEIDDLIVKGLEREKQEELKLKKGKGKKEEEEEEEEEEELLETDKVLDKTFSQRLQDKARLARLKDLNKILGEDEASPKKEEETITYAVDGVPLRLTTEQFLAIKRWEKESKAKSENTTAAKEQMITWPTGDGQTIQIPASSVPYMVLMDAQRQQFASFKEDLNELKQKIESKPTKNEEDFAEVTFPDGRKLKIKQEMYPYMMAIEREREDKEALREEMRSYDPLAQIKAQMDVMKMFGWAPAGKTQWDVISNVVTDTSDTVKFVGGKIVDKLGVMPEYHPEEKYTTEERASKLSGIKNKMQWMKRQKEAGDRILAT